MMTTDLRQEMTPTEFDAWARIFEQLCPWLSQTSGKRTEDRNASVGGTPSSKHLLGMARDYAWDVTVTDEQRAATYETATRLRFWWKPYDHGIHIQGLPRGPVADWWLAKYGPDRTSGDDPVGT